MIKFLMSLKVGVSARLILRSKAGDIGSPIARYVSSYTFCGSLAETGDFYKDIDLDIDLEH